jgi:opacity protein-like surface antigen
MVLILVLLLLPLTALAQQTPKVELFGGYSYFRGERGRNLHGWNGSITANLNKWFGLVADVSGHYDSLSFRFTGQQNNQNNISIFDSKTSKYTILVGPRLSYRNSSRLVPFAHALFGVTRDHEDSTTLSNDFSSIFKSNESGFAMAVGGGLDVELNRNLALRIIQADYSLTRVNGTQHNARISTGLVFRFGSK